MTRQRDDFLQWPRPRAGVGVPALWEGMVDIGRDPTLPVVWVPGERDVSAKKVNKGMSLAARYRGIDRCDRCGARLIPSQGLSGLCWRHRPRKVTR